MAQQPALCALTRRLNGTRASIRALAGRATSPTVVPRAALKGGNDEQGAQAGTKAVYVISVAAELSGMHAQTLRTYDRIGLVSPARTQGGGRRYSDRDIELLRKIQVLA